ncbi:MAG: PKD domain-containing protein, partial [Candidatus Omnitrophota bacterium]
STLSVTTITEKFSIKDSDSGEWRETVVPISTDTGGRMVYIITKGTQRYANAGFSMRTDKGDAIPIYFRRGAPPVASAPAPARPRPEAKPDLKCNKFTFDATSSYDPARQKLYFHWDFGDGNTSTEPVVTHIYEKGGEYTVRLTATNESGLPCDTAGTTQKILVNTPPAAAFSAPELVCVEDKVNFDASKTTDDTSETLTYMWNLGDGTRAEGQKVQHTYAKGGTYNVTLNVDDNAGTACSTDTIQRTIKVNTSPVADAGRDIDMCLKSIDEEYAVDLDGTRSRDPDGDDLSYVWNMGDGTTLQGAKVRHVYKTGGAYKATLTVDDGKGLPCSKASDALNVSLNKSPVAVISGEKKLCLGQSAAFDGSSSRVEQGQKLTYKWAMGDGSEVSGEKITHKYDKGGKYAVVLTVDDGKGTTCSSATDVAMIHVNSRPEASLGKVSDTCVGKRVSFDASESSDPDGDSLAYIWNFGDGTVETSGSRMTHTYQKGGKYTVSVTVDDGKGTPCSTSSDSVSLKVNTPPSARMTIGEECCVDMEQKFDGSGSIDPDGDALTYSWDFGDGSSGEGVRVSHSYAKPGTYKVTLRVDDGSGTECSADFTVGEMKVSGNPVAVIKVR